MIRSLGALSGGLLRGVGDVVLPAPLRRTVLYRAMVGVTLRFLIRDLGQVEGQYETSDPHHQNFVLQRSASHGIEIMGLIAFHASPVWVLAALADLTGGGHFAGVMLNIALIVVAVVIFSVGSRGTRMEMR